MKQKKAFVLLLCVLAYLDLISQVPADSVGLFAAHGDKMVRMEKMDVRKIKGTGGLASAFSFGLAKIKAKMEFSGATSDNVFEGSATFRMYFGTPAPEMIMETYMFAPSYSAKDFEVAKFKVKKKSRQLTGVSANLLGASAGVSSDEDVRIEAKEIRKDVYDVSVSAEPGEYCLIFTGGGTMGFGGVFDFTIK